MKFATAVVVYAAAIAAVSDFALAERKADTKHQRNKVENLKKDTEGVVLKEDTKYWSRFLKDTDYSLQTAPPSPSPSGYLPPPTPTAPPPTPYPTTSMPSSYFPPPTPTLPTPYPTTPAPSAIKKCLVEVSFLNNIPRVVSLLTNLF